MIAIFQERVCGMSKEYLLQVQNVTKRYGDKIALNNFSMDICPGEIVALIGENGAGKTTLLNIICGYIKPSAGQVQYKGENIIEKPLAIRGVSQSLCKPPN